MEADGEMGSDEINFSPQVFTAMVFNTAVEP